jgi:hypothetical protein
MTRRYARNPGQDSIAKWKAALAASRRQQRQRRGRRRDASSRISGPGMLRVTTVRSGEKEGPDGGHPGDCPGPPPAA